MKQGEILFFIGSVTIVVFAWVAFSLLHASLTSTISSQTIQAIIPINGTFDTKMIDAVRNRTQVNPITNLSQQVAPETVVTTGPIPTPIASGSSTIATSGGTLR